jgi:hypothetical protein
VSGHWRHLLHSKNARTPIAASSTPKSLPEDIEQCLTEATLALLRAKDLLIKARLLAAAKNPIAPSPPRAMSTVPGVPAGIGQRGIVLEDGLALQQIIARVRFHLGGIGPASARILIVLLERAGERMTPEHLARTVGSRTHDGSAVKVHIHKLRKALAAHGLQDALITGRSSYTLSAAYEERVNNLLGIE